MLYAYSFFVCHMRDKEEEYDRSVVCQFFFVCRIRGFPHTPARPFHYSFYTSVFVFLLFSLPCREQASPKQFGSFLPPLKREVGLVRQAGGISKEFTEFKKNVRDYLIPQSVRVAHSQLLTGESPLCHYVTFPHTVGNHPI